MIEVESASGKSIDVIESRCSGSGEGREATGGKCSSQCRFLLKNTVSGAQIFKILSPICRSAPSHSTNPQEIPDPAESLEMVA